MGMFDDLVPGQQAQPDAAGGLFDDLIPASPAAAPTAVDNKKYPYSADNPPDGDNAFVKERKIVNGKEYRLHQPTGAIYGPDDKATDDPDVMAAFGKTKLSKRAQARADINKPQPDFSPTSILDNAISSIPGIGQQYGAAKWAIQTGKEIADTPQETTDALANAAQQPDQSSMATDWQAGTNNAKTAYLGQQIIGLRTELSNLTRTANERPDDPLIQQRLARTKDAYQRAFQMYDEASGQQFPQNPAFAALHDNSIPGTAAQKTAAALRADPWGVARTLTLQSGPVSIPSVAGGIIGSIAAGRAGAALGAGVPSAYIEAGLNLRDQIAARGADMNDPASRRATFEKYADEIIRDAQISGLIVGAGDAAGAAFGSGVAALKGEGTGNLVGKELVGTIADALFGAAGEGGKQVYNTGEISDPQSLIDEGLGEVVAGGVQQGGMMAVEGLKSASGKTDRQAPPPKGQRIEPRLFSDEEVFGTQAQPPAGNKEGKLTIPPEGIPPAAAMADTDILRQTGYSFEQIADMNPAERAQATQEARQQGVQPIGTIAPDAPAPGTSTPAPGFGTRRQRAPIQTEQDMAAVRPVVNAEPSEAQAAAGNYQKGHVNLHGLDISIENPKGSVRRGTDPDTGEAWASPSLPADYGYIKGTKGKDGDHVDVYIGPNPQSDRVYVIDQVSLKDGKFDEHKAVLGASSPQEAVDLYANSFDVPTLDRIGDVTEMSIDEFKAWSKNGRATKRPVGNVQPVNPIREENSPRIVRPVGNVQPTGLTVPPRPQFAPVDTSQNDAADKAFDSFMASRKPITQEAFAAASGLDLKEAGRAIQRAALAGRVIQGRNGNWRRPPTRSTPIDALDFIASIGGIQDVTGELAGMNLPKMGPFGPAVRKNGLHPDKVREALVEAGYLRDAGRDTGGQAQTTVDDVYQLLDAHMRGRKTYSTPQDQAAADAIEVTKKNENANPDYVPVHPIAQRFGMETWAKLQAFFTEFGSYEEAWSQGEIADAARLVSEGWNADDAFERAAFLHVDAIADPEQDMDPDLTRLFAANRNVAVQAIDHPPFPDTETPDAIQQPGPQEASAGVRPIGSEGANPGDQAEDAGPAAQVPDLSEGGSEAGSAVSEEVGSPPSWVPTVGTIVTLRPQGTKGKGTRYRITSYTRFGNGPEDWVFHSDDGYGGGLTDGINTLRPTTEAGADNLPQTVIPGAEAVSEADAAKAAKAEKARKELEARRKQSKLRKSGQESVEDQDGGLFGGKGPKQSSLLDAPEPQPETQAAFDAEKWNKDRADRIAASRAAGKTHLDKIEPAVETMRGLAIYNVHDPKERGVIRTVANTGEVVIHWSDAYSAKKNLATEKFERRGKRAVEVYESWLGPRDLKDYVADGMAARDNPSLSRKPKSATPSDATPQTEQTEAKPNSGSDKPNSVSVDKQSKPATTPEKQAEFRAFIDRRKKEADEFQVEFERVITEQKGFKAQQQITDVRGKALTKFIMVTPSAQPGVKWQLTFGDNEGPSGHLDINNMEELAREVRGFIRNGYEAKGRFKLNIQIKSTETVADEAVASLKPTPAKIEDFGEKIIGARKDAVRDIVKSLTDDVDVTTEPLSKTFPQPDYVKMAEAGVDREALAYVALFRAEIPTKPQKSWKVKQWSEQVKILRDFSHKLLSGQMTAAAIRKKIYDDMPILAKVARTAEIIKDIEPKYLAYASQYSIASSQVSVLRGQTFKPAKQMFLLESDKQRWTNVDAETLEALREPALAFIRKKAEAELGADGEGKPRRTPLMLYKDRFTKEIFIGFKGRVEVIRLKTGFKDVKEARLYMADKADELQAQIDAMRQEPDLRRAANAPRSGPPRRPGDATPELFQEAFGFRGVQFGNYVEGDRRQSDLNEAFDALMDLADTLGIPSQALSLGGKLGIAFGARGHGGKRAAAAHYEPGQVVINLTKHAGPGSLAHEWLHALDNYFARLNNDGKGGGYISEAKTRGDVRESVWQAWKAVEKSIAKGSFAKRSDELDAARSKAYYGTTIEKAARAFERYIVDRLAEKQTNNDYLANIDTSGGAFPTAEEMQEAGIRAAFDDLFAAIEVTKNERGQAVLSSRANRLSSAANRPVFYSGLLRAVESLKQDKAPAAQWLGTIRNTSGVKPEEVAWLGLDDWLSSQTGTVTKAQIADFVRANQVQVSEVEKGRVSPQLDQEHQRLVDERSRLAAEYEDLTAIGAPTDDLVDRMNVLHDRIRDIEETEPPAPKFEQYQLPGGENYRELLLTLPSTTPTVDTTGWRVEETPNNFAGNFAILNAQNEVISYVEDGLADEQMIEAAAKAYAKRSAPKDQYRSGHWDEPNVVAHVRFNERTVDGQKVLFIEEIQSDFAQAYRKQKRNIAQAVDRDFDAIAAKMVEAGIIQKDCD